MKKKFLYVSVATVLVVLILFKSGLFYIGVSPYAHYRLNEIETKLVEDWITQFHKNVENGDFDEIRKELEENKQSLQIQSSELKNAKFAFDKYGKVDFINFFRCMPPRPASEFYGKELEGNVYGLFYHSNAERGRLSESFELIINNDKVSLLRYHGDEMKEWETGSDNNEYWLNRNLPKEIRIPFGDRFIEIRY